MAAGEPEGAAAAAEGAEAPAEATEGKEGTGGADAQVNGVKPAASTDPLSFPPHGTEVQCPLPPSVTPFKKNVAHLLRDKTPTLPYSILFKRCATRMR